MASLEILPGEGVGFKTTYAKGWRLFLNMQPVPECFRNHCRVFAGGDK